MDFILEPYILDLDYYWGVHGESKNTQKRDYPSINRLLLGRIG